MKKLIISLLLVFLMIFVSADVYASQALDRAQRDYQFQLDTYRGAYDEFVLRRTDFENNSSFANQEVMVLAAKEMLMKRAKVWQTYFQVMKVKLWEVEGMDEELKNDLIGQLDDNVVMLNENETSIETLDTRVPLLQAANVINAKEDEFNNLSYQIIMELTLARFKWAVQQLRVFNAEIDAALDVQVRNNSERQLKKRAVGEVNLILDGLDEKFVEVDKVAHKQTGTQKYSSRYPRVIEALSPLYSDMLRAYSIVDEVTQELIR